jgi:hypothetical protein
MNKAAKALQDQEKNSKSSTPTMEMTDTMRKLLNGEDILESIETQHGVFVIKFPRPRVLRQIQMLLSQRFVGVDLSKLPDKNIRFHEIYATLDVVVVRAPQWWDDLDSSEDCPDDNLVMTLYRRYLRFYNRVQQEISGTGEKPGEHDQVGTGGSEKADVGDGPFSGVTFGSKVSGTP